jgi:hypothetical protein
VSVSWKALYYIMSSALSPTPWWPEFHIPGRVLEELILSFARHTAAFLCIL